MNETPLEQSIRQWRAMQDRRERWEHRILVGGASVALLAVLALAGWPIHRFL